MNTYIKGDGMRSKFSLFGNGETVSREQLLLVCAQGWYAHLEKYGHETGCCDPRSGIYCREGKDLKQGYLSAAEEAQSHVH
ncbi:MAG: hypothetical protein AB2693_34215 [Candidatus Thiodiazotropha sp.]